MGRTVLIFNEPEAAGNPASQLLERNGYRVEQADSAKSARLNLEAHKPDLVVLIPDAADDQIERCREIRRISELPMLIIAANQDDLEELRLLAAGADDYVAMIRSPRAIVARTERLAFRRQRSAVEQRRYEFGGLVVDIDARLASWCGQQVRLTRTEFEILQLLTANTHRVVSRRELLNAVWGAWYGDDHVLEVHLSRLRRKFVSVGAGPAIATIRGVGYRLLLPSEPFD